MEALITRKMFRATVLGLFVVFALAASQAAAQGNREAGAELYKNVLNCKECHGDGGKGDGFVLPLLKVKVQMHDWTDKAVMSPLTDDYLAEIIIKGGEALGKSEVMLKYADQLTDQQVKDLVAFIRSLAR
jgi:mono/diheme cytochrome c family protein